jgi:hypothetical protein
MLTSTFVTRTTLRSHPLTRIQRKIIQMVVCKLNESIEKGGNFEGRCIMIDGSYFRGGVSLMMVVLNKFEKLIEHMSRIGYLGIVTPSQTSYARIEPTLSVCLKSALIALFIGEYSFRIYSETSK